MAKQKFYVVWKGRETGIFGTWADCQAQITGVSGAEYKSFASRAEAERAFGESYAQHRVQKERVAKTLPRTLDELEDLGMIVDSIAVDAACSGNPGDLEYRGVETSTGDELFREGPYPDGTVNVGEFLAIVHGLAFLKRLGRTCPVYSDSNVALGWIEARRSRSKMSPTRLNQKLFELIQRAETWLAQNTYPNPLLKWETDRWGENPADFGRK